MPESKAELSNRLSNQEAIAKILAPARAPTKTVTIPGGKNILSKADFLQLKSAIYTWIRAIRKFREFKIQFVEHESLRQPRRIKIHDFPPGAIFWERDNGKEDAADLLAKYILGNVCTSIELLPEGIFVNKVPDGTKLSSEDSDWVPKYHFVKKVGQ